MEWIGVVFIVIVIPVVIVAVSCCAMSGMISEQEREKEKLDER